MVSLGNLDVTGRFLATSRGTDVFPVGVSVFSAQVHPFLTVLAGLSLALPEMAYLPNVLCKQCGPIFNLRILCSFSCR